MKYLGWKHKAGNQGFEIPFYWKTEIVQEVKMTQLQWDESSPLAKLLASRKFLLMVLDVVLSLVLYFGTKYLDPNAVEDVKQLILVLQPVVVTIIYAIAKEDSATAEAEAKVRVAQAELEKVRLENS